MLLLFTLDTLCSEALAAEECGVRAWAGTSQEGLFERSWEMLGFEQAGLVEGVPASGMGVGTKWS